MAASNENNDVPSDEKFLDDEGMVTEPWLDYFRSLTSHREDDIILSTIINGLSL